mgnify:CR=1 FL=1|tara:strand:+ start:171 stop:719 length:549 start_codon:yes stop_codon:yes gene_type:complete
MVKDFSKGKIYKIVNNLNTNTYVGSTISTLCKRMGKHRELNNKCMSKNIGVDLKECSIILVEKYPCKDNTELRSRERFYFDKYKLEGLNLVNKNRPIVTKEEKKELQTIYKNNNKDKAINWKNANLEKVRNYKKKFKINNKEQRKIKDKVKYTCECGSICSIGNKSHHNKSQKHQKYLKTLI